MSGFPKYLPGDTLKYYNIYTMSVVRGTVFAVKNDLYTTNRGVCIYTLITNKKGFTNEIIGTATVVESTRMVLVEKIMPHYRGYKGKKY